MYSYQYRRQKKSNSLLRPHSLEVNPVPSTQKIDPEKEQQLILLLSGISYKQISAAEQARLNEAGEILRGLDYLAQQAFYLNYPELADIYFNATTGKQLFGPSPGFFAGLDFTVGQKNVVLELLADDRTYWEENAPLRTLLGIMVGQVGDIWSQAEPTAWQGKSALTEDEVQFLNAVIDLLATHAATLPHPQDTDVNTNASRRGFMRAAVSGMQQVRQSWRGLKSDGHVLNLYNYSLAELQANNEWKGDIYGMQFADRSAHNYSQKYLAA
jgi:hypothetical protein